MSVIVFAVPYAPPPPPVPLWNGLSVVWEGWDGSVWDLHDPDRGVYLLPEVTGWHFPGFDRQTSKSPARAGQRFRRARAKERTVEWNVLVWSDLSSEAWLDVDEAWWHSVSPEKPGRLRVTTPAGRTRHLSLLLNDTDGGYSYRYDPAEAGWAVYPVTMIADDPYWVGEPIEESWEAEVPQEFFDPAGSPEFHIASESRIETATMTNPGDVSAWSTWRVTAVTGAVTSTTVTVAGGSFTLPAIAEGKTAVTDTGRGTTHLGTWDDAAKQLLDPVEISGQVTPWRPRPIPAGQAVPIGIDMDGFGKVTAKIEPRYYRVFGGRAA